MPTVYCMLGQHTAALAFTLHYIVNLFPHKGNRKETVPIQIRSACCSSSVNDGRKQPWGIGDHWVRDDLCRFILAGCCISVHYFSAAHHKRTGNRMDGRNRRLCMSQRWQRRASRNWQKTDTSSESAALSPFLSIFSWVFIKHRTLPTAGGPPIRLSALMSKCSSGKQLYCYCTVRLFFFFFLSSLTQ